MPRKVPTGGPEPRWVVSAILLLVCFGAGFAMALPVRRLLRPVARETPTPETPSPDASPPDASPPTPATPDASPPDASPPNVPSSQVSPPDVSPTSDGTSAVDAPVDAEAAEREFQGGLGFLRQERNAEALEAFKRAAELDVTDPRPHYGMGKIYRKLVLEAQAERAFRRSIEVEQANALRQGTPPVPVLYESQKELVKMLYDRGDYADAMTLLADMEKERPQDPFVWAEMAISHIGLGNPAEAVPLLEKYNAVQGRQAWGYTHLGRAYADTGQLEKAEVAYREALAIDKRFALAYYWLGQLLANSGRKADADKLLGTYRQLRTLQDQAHQLGMALQASPDDLPKLVELARIRFALGQARESLVLLERARKLAPNDQRLIQIYQNVRRAAEQESRGAGGKSKIRN